MNKIMKNVVVGQGTVVEDFAIIGYPERGKKEGELKTIIGKNTIIQPCAIVYAGVEIGDNCFIASGAVIREGSKIGNNVSIGNNTIILPHATIEDDVKIHTLVEVAEYTRLKKGSWVGPGVIMANTLHPKPFVNYADKERADREGGPVIGEHARIGINATVMPFVEIGDYSIVGGGAVVTRSVPPESVVVGNPARVTRNVNEITSVYDKTIRPYDTSRFKKKE